MRIKSPDNWVKGQGATLPYIPIPSTYGAEVNFFQTSLPFKFTLINGATGVTTGQSDPYYLIDTLGRNQFAIQVVGTATVLLEGTLDGENWVTVDTITAASIKQYNGLYMQLRVSITAFTSGPVTVMALMQRN